MVLGDAGVLLDLSTAASLCRSQSRSSFTENCLFFFSNLQRNSSRCISGSSNLICTLHTQVWQKTALFPVILLPWESHRQSPCCGVQWPGKRIAPESRSTQSEVIIDIVLVFLLKVYRVMPWVQSYNYLLIIHWDKYYIPTNLQPL